MRTAQGRAATVNQARRVGPVAGTTSQRRSRFCPTPVPRYTHVSDLTPQSVGTHFCFSLTPQISPCATEESPTFLATSPSRHRRRASADEMVSMGTPKMEPYPYPVPVLNGYIWVLTASWSPQHATTASPLQGWFRHVTLRSLYSNILLSWFSHTLLLAIPLAFTSRPVVPALIVIFIQAFSGFRALLPVVDEDPTWQKSIDPGEENDDNSSEGEKPLVDEDIDVKRMKRLEQLRARRPYHAISEDGSGWVSLSSKSMNPSDLNNDMSPPRKQRVRNDTPSPEPELNPSTSNQKGADLSPSHQRLKRNDTPSPERVSQPAHSKELNSDLSPPCKRRVQSEDTDLSPPRQRRRGHHTPSAQPNTDSAHVTNVSLDISPPRRPYDGKKNYETKDLQDLSPPRRVRHDSPSQDTLHGFATSDLSPPRKNQKNVARSGLSDHSHRRSPSPSVKVVSHPSSDLDLSPPRKNPKELSILASVNDRKTGLISGKDIRNEIERKRKDDLLRFKQMDPSISGRGAEPVYRDNKGVRITKEEYLKSKQKVEEKPKEKEIEWGKGLAQKREAEARLKELELEKEKPFARTRDDPDLDKMLKERLRWGDPMAHLVKVMMQYKHTTSRKMEEFDQF
ncbi:Bud13 [Sesbania bispinosa]|nr:Bud13 [Sesbania bispinosa]